MSFFFLFKYQRVPQKCLYCLSSSDGLLDICTHSTISASIPDLWKPVCIQPHRYTIHIQIKLLSIEIDIGKYPILNGSMHGNIAVLMEKVKDEADREIVSWLWWITNDHRRSNWGLLMVIQSWNNKYFLWLYGHEHSSRIWYAVCRKAYLVYLVWLQARFLDYDFVFAFLYLCALNKRESANQHQKPQNVLWLSLSHICAFPIISQFPKSNEFCSCVCVWMLWSFHSAKFCFR